MNDKEFAVELTTWLSFYTDEVINKIMAQIDDIKNNELARMLIHELHVRCGKEKASFTDSIYLALISDDVANRAYHLDVLTHSRSYRDVLHDMYVK